MPSVCTPSVSKCSYRFEVAEQANPAGPHLIKLNGDASFGSDAGDCSLSILLMNNLASKPEAPINTSNDRQHRHQTSHSRTLRIGKILLQKTLKYREGKFTTSSLTSSMTPLVCVHISTGNIWKHCIILQRRSLLPTGSPP